MKILLFILGIAVGLLIIYFLSGKSLGKSLMMIASNFLLGFGSLYLCNYVSAWSGFGIPVNGVTLATSGVLGLPGTLLSAALQVFVQL